MRCGCLLVIASVVLIVLGLQGIREAHAYSKPVDITVEQFMRSAPPEGWYRIKGGQIDVLDSVYIVTKERPKGSSATDDSKETDTDKTTEPNKHTEKDARLNSDPSQDKQGAKPAAKPKTHSTKQQDAAADKTNPNSTGDTAADPTQPNDPGSDTTADDNKRITEVYIPVHSLPQWNMQTHAFPPTNLVIKTSDPAIIDIANQVKHINDMKPEDQFKWLDAHKDQVILHRDIEGMVQAGLHADPETRDLLAKDQDNLTPGYQIVEEGLKPSMSGGIGSLFGGILLGIVSILYWGSYLFRRNRRLT